MDTIIAEKVTKRKRLRNLLIGVVFIILIISAVLSMRFFIEPSVNRNDITIATVELGSIENTISATGEVIPEFEEVIPSPIRAVIRHVTMSPGAHIKPGQTILSLDKEATIAEYEKLKFQLEMKRNSIKKLRLDLDKSFYDIKSNNEIKQLRINSLQNDVEDAKRLFKAGGGTRESIEQAEMALKVALLEKKQLENEIKSKQQTMLVEIRESELSATIQEADLRTLEKKLKQADIVANREGVITWVNKNIGTSVTEGEALVRIADLGSFKVKGSISDSYLDRLSVNMPVIIKINDSTLRGTVTNIQPAVQNSVVTFDIALNSNNTTLLRPNMKVDVNLVTSKQNNVMRVANGPAFKGSAAQDIYVVKNNTAERRTVEIGLSNFDHVQLLNQVAPGDKIIISDMSNFKNTKLIKIN